MLEKTKTHSKTKSFVCNRRFVAIFMPVRRALVHKSFGFTMVLKSRICTFPVLAHVREPLCLVGYQLYTNWYFHLFPMWDKSSLPFSNFSNFIGVLLRVNFSFTLSSFQAYQYSISISLQRRTQIHHDTNTKWFLLKFKPQYDHLWFLISHHKLNYYMMAIS